MNDARRQDHADRIALGLGRRDARERAAQAFGIIVDRLDAARPEELGEHPHHDLAVLEHVADARRGAAVVLEHEELVRPGSHEVDADDVAVDPARRGDADDRGLVGLVAEHQIRRGRRRRARSRRGGRRRGGSALSARARCFTPRLQPPPFGLGEDPRHHVEGDQPLGVAALAVDREGDADPAEQRLGLLLLLGEDLGRRGLHPVEQPLVGRTHPVAVEHLVEGRYPRLPPPLATAHLEAVAPAKGKPQPGGRRTASRGAEGRKRPKVRRKRKIVRARRRRIAWQCTNHAHCAGAATD